MEVIYHCCHFITEITFLRLCLILQKNNDNRKLMHVFFFILPCPDFFGSCSNFLCFIAILIAYECHSCTHTQSDKMTVGIKLIFSFDFIKLNKITLSITFYQKVNFINVDFELHIK